MTMIAFPGQDVKQAWHLQQMLDTLRLEQAAQALYYRVDDVLMHRRGASWASLRPSAKQFYRDCALAVWREAGREPAHLILAPNEIRPACQYRAEEIVRLLDKMSDEEWAQDAAGFLALALESSCREQIALDRARRMEERRV